MDDLYQTFNFSASDHSKYKDTVFLCFTLIGKKKYPIILKLEIISYFT